MNKLQKLKIFCDFDGTAASNDVWLNTLGKFIPDKSAHDKLIEDYSNGLISTRECIKRELELIKNFNLNQFYNLVEDETLDPYFKHFFDYCSNKNYPVVIVSEGFDLYIEKILQANNLALPFYCNNLIVSEDSSLSCGFPHSDEHCNWCGVSKRNILINNTNDLEGEVSVFIGDGVTDFCVSGFADIVFAKGKLASYCWKNNITYFEYKNFLDITNKLEKLEQKNKIKQRQEAAMRRREILMGG